MATTIDDIGDLFMVRISDPRLVVLYNASGSSMLNTYLENFLLDSIDEFDGICDQALVYSTSTQAFSVDLTQKNKNLLSHLMVKYWLAKEIKDIQQMRVHIQDRDFKNYSESQNLKSKLEAYSLICEDISQRLVNYGIKYAIDWDDWNDQDFS